MHRPNSQSKTEGQLYRLVASYLCAVVIRVENRLLATGLDGVKQTVQYPDRLQMRWERTRGNGAARQLEEGGAELRATQVQSSICSLGGESRPASRRPGVGLQFPGLVGLLVDCPNRSTPPSRRRVAIGRLLLPCFCCRVAVPTPRKWSMQGTGPSSIMGLTA